MLETDAIDKLVAEEAKEEARLRTLHTAMAQAVGVKYTDRLPAQVVDKLRKEVAGNWYPNQIAFEKALATAGVPAGFVGQLKEGAHNQVDEAQAGEYVKKNIFRYDYSLPKIR